MFATTGCSIKFWDAQNYSFYQEIPSGRVNRLTWTQNGQCLGSLEEGASEVSLFAVNAKSTANIGGVRALDHPSCLKFPCRSSHYLGVGSKDGIVALWNLKTKSLKKTFPVTNSSISHIAFSHNDSHIAASSKGSLYLLSTMNNGIEGPFKIFDQDVTDVIYSMVKKALVGCCSEGGSVTLFDSHASKVVHTFASAHASPVSSVAFSPINELLMLSVGYDKKFICYSILTKKQVFTHKSSAPLTSAALLPGCQHIALGAMTGEVFIHDLRTLKKPLKTLNAHDKAVRNIVLQPSMKQKVDGATGDSKTMEVNHRKKRMNIKGSSGSSSEMRTQEEVPVDADHRNEPENCAATAGPSLDIMSILSPVRSPEQAVSVDGATGDSKTMEVNHRKKRMNIKGSSGSSSEMRTQEEVPVDAVYQNEPENCAATAGPSFDIMSILSPVRSPEQAVSVTHELKEETKDKHEVFGVMSPMQSAVITSKAYLSSPMDNEGTSCQEIFSPVRIGQDDFQKDFQDILSPVRMTNTESENAAEGASGSSNLQCFGKEQSYPSPSRITHILNTSVEADLLPSEENVPQTNSALKENVDPKKRLDTTRTPHKEEKDTDVMIGELSLPKITPLKEERDNTVVSRELSVPKPLSPAQLLQDKKHNYSNRKPKKYVAETLEPHLYLLPEPNLCDIARNQTNSIISTKMTEKTPVVVAENVSSNVTEYEKDFPNTFGGRTPTRGVAANMQVELIRSCMTEALEDFQDDVNRRMMHLQYVVTKQFLQLKETVDELRNQHSLIEEVLVENEKLRKENTHLRANF